VPFDHFDFIAPLYNRQSAYPSLEIMLEYADLPTDGRLLDVGGGTGRVASVLREHAREVIVADTSLGMLRFAASKPGLQVIAALSEQLPFTEDSFQRVIMVDAFHHVVDQNEAARELMRVLKPGGRIVIEEPDINTFGAKLVAFIEKLLLMRSHFLSPHQIAYLFHPKQGRISTKGLNSWVVIEK
jgi:demethylmenaquinone methyltransferase/2-methoxy-6-polyprenyl-1,4-benzoquinol methylase